MRPGFWLLRWVLCVFFGALTRLPDLSHRKNVWRTKNLCLETLLSEQAEKEQLRQWGLTYIHTCRPTFRHCVIFHEWRISSVTLAVCLPTVNFTSQWLANSSDFGFLGSKFPQNGRFPAPGRRYLTPLALSLAGKSVTVQTHEIAKTNSNRYIHTLPIKCTWYIRWCCICIGSTTVFVFPTTSSFCCSWCTLWRIASTLPWRHCSTLSIFGWYDIKRLVLLAAYVYAELLLSVSVNYPASSRFRTLLLILLLKLLSPVVSHPSYALSTGSELLNASNTSSSHLPAKFSQLPNLHTFITWSLFNVLAVLALHPSLLLLGHLHHPL